MRGSSNSIAQYRERFQEFGTLEAQRNELLADLLNQYEELQFKYQQQRDDFDNEREARRNWQIKAQSMGRLVVSSST